MSEIIYDHQATEVRIGPVGLNGRGGAIEVFKDHAAAEDCDEFVVFQSPQAVFDFIDSLEGRMAAAGHIRGIG